MREKYESLSLVVLKDLAKARGLKGISTMKKGELIDRMLQEDEREKEEAPKAKTVYTARTASGQEGRKHTPKPRREEHPSHTEDHSHPEHGESMHAEHGAHASQEQTYKVQEDNDSAAIKEDIVSLDSGNTASGILEVMADGFGFIRCENYLPGEHDVYVAPSQIRRFNLKTGDIVCGNTKVKSEREKFSALLYVTSVNGYHPSEAQKRTNVEVIYSTFDETAEHHKRVSEMVIERAKRLVEHKKDVMILLDSITRLARAYNLTCTPSGRTLSGGLDPAALHMPKRFFGAARNMREGGSLTILATALVDTGSKMDDVVFEEFKGTGNMELVLDRKLSEKRIFPAVDIVKSGTRRDDLLLDPQEREGVENMRRALNGMRSDEAVENILNMFAHTRTNADFINLVRKNRIL